MIRVFFSLFICFFQKSAVSFLVTSNSAAVECKTMQHPTTATMFTESHVQPQLQQKNNNSFASIAFDKPRQRSSTRTKYYYLYLFSIFFCLNFIYIHLTKLERLFNRNSECSFVFCVWRSFT